MKSRRILLAIAGGLALSGCASTHTGMLEPIDPADFGEANRQTYAAMVIDPDPQYAEPLATSAEHAADAIERYRDDAVKQPERTSSTEGSGSGG